MTGLGLLGLAISIGGITLMIYHWGLIERAFINILTKLAGL